MFSEDIQASWQARYGEPAPQIDARLEPYLRHRSVRDFENKAICEADMSGLLAAAQSAATSSNLQTFSVISVTDQVKREELARIAGDQKQILTAGKFLVFVADNYRLKQQAVRHGEPAEGLDYAEFFVMAVVDAALAAERLVAAAEAIGLGICYIGALRNDVEAVANLLELPERTFPVFGLCLGYPAEDSQAAIKPRLPQRAIFFEDAYNKEPDVEDYDSRMVQFYTEQKMKGEVTWSMRSARRANLNQMVGREKILPWLHEQKMCLH